MTEAAGRQDGIQETSNGSKGRQQKIEEQVQQGSNKQKGTDLGNRLGYRLDKTRKRLEMYTTVKQDFANG